MLRDDQFCIRSVTGVKTSHGIGALLLQTPGGFQETYSTHGMLLIHVALVMEIMLGIANFQASIAP
jgi:hypothetical protein